jgi:hypothetical protein
MNASETLDDFEPKVALAAAKRNEFCDILRLTSSCRRQSHATQNTVLFIRSNGVADDIVSTMSSSSFESTIGQSTVADLCQIVAQSNTLSSSSSTSSTSSTTLSSTTALTPDEALKHGTLSDVALVLFFLPFGVIPVLIVGHSWCQVALGGVESASMQRRPAQLRRNGRRRPGR